VDDFGSVKNPKTGKKEVVKRYTWTSDSGMLVQVSDGLSKLFAISLKIDENYCL
jgi:hypothetical protein